MIELTCANAIDILTVSAAILISIMKIILYIKYLTSMKKSMVNNSMEIQKDSKKNVMFNAF